MKITLLSLLLSLAATAPLLAQDTSERSTSAADQNQTTSVQDQDQTTTAQDRTQNTSAQDRNKNTSANDRADADRAVAREGKDHDATDMEKSVLAAVLTPTKGNEARGVVTFEPLEKDEVRISVRLSGLKPNAKHAMHVHEFGDISSDDGSSAGGHFNPTGKAHGLPDNDERHVGDFGNLETDADGNANHVLTVRELALVKGENAIIGRALIVHAGEDKGTQPSGDAGDRIAQGVIAIANPASMKSGVADATKNKPADERAATGESGTDTSNASNTSNADDTSNSASTASPTAGERLERAAERVGEGAENAARTTVKAVERGAEEVGEVLKKVGETIEDAVE